MYTKITMNMVGARCRKETLEGKEYLAVPTVMLTEGVHTGSQGPLLYKSEELNKRPVIWNYKPVVIRHPSENGEGISACDPKVIEAQKCGLMLNTGWDGRLKTECWLDETKADKIDKRVLQAVKAGKMVEVSTGLFHDPDMTPGVWNGEKYDGIVKNIQADHLAILMDEKGACSIEKGGGMLRNADGSAISYDDIREQLRVCLKNQMATDNGGNGEIGYCYIVDVFPKFFVYEKNGSFYQQNYKTKDGKVSISGEPEEVRKFTQYVTANGLWVANEDSGTPQSLAPLSSSDLSPEAIMQLAGQEWNKEFGKEWDGWVMEVYYGYLIWKKDGKIFQLPYSYADATISFNGPPIEVEMVSGYRPRTTENSQESDMANTPAAKPAQNTIHQSAASLTTEPAKTTPRSEAVTKLITSGVWGEGDRLFLETCPDAAFNKIVNPVTAPAPHSAAATLAPDLQAAVANQTPAAGMSMADWIKTMPPDYQEIVQNSLKVMEAQKKALVANILTNPGNRFTEAWLLAQKVDLLQGMASLSGTKPAAANVHNYSGQADIPMFMDTQPITGNAAAPGEGEYLEAPSLEFKKKTA